MPLLLPLNEAPQRKSGGALLDPNQRGGHQLDRKRQLVELRAGHHAIDHVDAEELRERHADVKDTLLGPVHG